MRTAWMLPLACLLMVGCEAQPAFVGRVNVVESRGLAVGVEVPAKIFYVGQRFTVKVTARNLTDSPLPITARTGAPVYVHLSRFTGLYEEEFRTYPEAALTIMRQWTLAPHETRTYPLDLTVAPEWPRNEALHLTAEINGRPDAQPVVVIEIASNPPPSQTAKPADAAKATPATKPSGAIKVAPFEPTPLTMPAGQGPTTKPTTTVSDSGGTLIDGPTPLYMPVDNSKRPVTTRPKTAIPRELEDEAFPPQR